MKKIWQKSFDKKYVKDGRRQAFCSSLHHEKHKSMCLLPPSILPVPSNVLTNRQCAANMAAPYLFKMPTLLPYWLCVRSIDKLEEHCPLHQLLACSTSIWILRILCVNLQHQYIGKVFGSNWCVIEGSDMFALLQHIVYSLGHCVLI